MSSSTSETVTLLLKRWSKGDRGALEELSPLIYQELHKLAGGYMRREHPDHTLQPTALVHEAYLRLAGSTLVEWQSRAHFYGIAANAMRRILVEHARHKNAKKRGDGAVKVPLDDALAVSTQRSTDMVELDRALNELAAFDDRKSRIIELRYFGGLTAEEIAEVVGASTATVNRDLKVAQAWLYGRLSEPPASV